MRRRAAAPSTRKRTVVPHAPARAMDDLPDGGLAFVEDRPDGGVVLVEDVAQQERGALLRRQPLQRHEKRHRQGVLVM